LISRVIIVMDSGGGNPSTQDPGRVTRRRAGTERDGNAPARATAGTRCL